MVRIKLVYGFMVLLVLASACEKAKMRTVPPSNQAAAANAAPDYHPEDDSTYESDVPTEVKAEEPVELPPAEEPVNELALEDVERERPVRRPPPRVEEECCESPQENCAQVPVRRHTPRPVVREEIVREGIVFELDGDLHCRWEPTGRPTTYLRYNPLTGVAMVKHGWPQIWTQFTNVRVVEGMGPFGRHGVALVSENGLWIAALTPSSNASLGLNQRTKYPFEARYGNVPGRPNGSNRGVCWTKRLPQKTVDRS